MWQQLGMCPRFGYSSSVSNSYSKESSVLWQHLRFDLVCPNSFFCSFKCFQSKLLDICLCRHVIMHGIIVWILGFPALQLVHHVGGVSHAFVVLGVKALLQDLLQNTVVTCGIQVSDQP